MDVILINNWLDDILIGKKIEDGRRHKKVMKNDKWEDWKIQEIKHKRQ